MVSFSTWCRYVSHKLLYSLAFGVNSYQRGQFSTRTEVLDFAWKNFFQGKLTYLHWDKGDEMALIITGQGANLLVQKIPKTEPAYGFKYLTGKTFYICWRCCRVEGDPENADNYLLQRLIATEGHEMVSTDEKDEPFVLEKDLCWALSDNKNLKDKEAKDSRLFGPVSMTDIVGRVIYCLRTAEDHGPVENNDFGMTLDSSVLEVELDVGEMAKTAKKS